jgi:RNA-directed DNA polymerase
VGVRRPQKRRLHAQVLLDPDPPTPARPPRSVPDAPAVAEYCARRRQRAPLPINKTTQGLIDAQDGRCSICGGTLITVDNRPQNPREWEQWLATTRQAIHTIATREPGTPEEATPRLVHAECQHGHGLALHNAYQPSGLA